MAYTAGVDVGSTQTKAVVIDENETIVGRALIDTGANVIEAAQNAFDIALKDAGVDEEQVEYVVGTGYGRYKVTFGTRRSPRSAATAAARCACSRTRVR